MRGRSAAEAMRCPLFATFPVAAAASVCDNTTFPVSEAGVKYTGLRQETGVRDAAGCARACCDAGAGCAVWMWGLSGEAGGYAGTCWIGASSSKHAAARWLVRRRAPPPPPPTPPPPPGPDAPFVPSREPNMNGPYRLNLAPLGDNSTHPRFPAQYRDWPRGARYFDVYSPTISSLYSQVFWTALGAVAIPEEVVRRYAGGKVMAMIGFEMDQVRRTPRGDVSVPISASYNHHFTVHMAGAQSRVERVDLMGEGNAALREEMDGGHGVPREAWVVRDGAPGASGAPTTLVLGGGNGGEYRKTFHGYPPGYAQIIESPRQLMVTPMQIDTWNRDEMNISSGVAPFVPGPVPRNSWAPTGGPDALYSGLLECPLTTRLRKDVDAGYATLPAGRCAHAVQTAGECFSAAEKELKAAARTEAVVDDAAHPPGCSAAADPRSGAVAVTYNTAARGPDCGDRAAARAGAASSVVDLNISVDLAARRVMIAVAGPDGAWFGVGLNATAMRDAPWALIVDGHGAVSERLLADQGQGIRTLAASVTVEASSVSGGRRTVVVSRAMKGATPDHYSFDAGQGVALPFIGAVGDTAELAYHKDKGAGSLPLLPVGGAGACVCASAPVAFGKAKGALRYVRTDQPGDVGSGSVGFYNRCAPPPRGSLYEQRNPTCDVRAYVGGQIACHHMWSLLDADQPIPWHTQPLEYVMKFRFWYQDYDPAYHAVLRYSGGSTNWDVGAGGRGDGVGAEYDVPKCADGVAGCSRDPDGTWVHTITGTFMGSGSPVVAHMHCHAPTCLTMAVYNNKTGALICMERAVYGGSGKADNPAMDEPGFILVPPCVWGRAEQGLTPPPDLTGVLLHVVKTANATHGHHGEMAHGQIFYA